VREKNIKALIEMGGTAVDVKSLTVGEQCWMVESPVLELSAKAAEADGKVTLVAPWANPVLWGSRRTVSKALHLCAPNCCGTAGWSIDVTRFGFREVWTTGRDVS